MEQEDRERCAVGRSGVEAMLCCKSSADHLLPLELYVWGGASEARRRVYSLALTADCPFQNYMLDLPPGGACTLTEVPLTLFP